MKKNVFRRAVIAAASVCVLAAILTAAVSAEDQTDGTVKKDDKVYIGIITTEDGSLALGAGSPGEGEIPAAPAVSVVGQEKEEPGGKQRAALSAAVVPSFPFTDVADDAYYRDPVAFAVSRGITTGVSDTLFDPDGNCTRAQIVTFIWRLMDCPEPESLEVPFEDISAGDYFFKAVLWAAEQGITTGTDDRHFSPDAVVTREQAVTFLFRLEGSRQVNGVLFFDDVPEDSYSREAIRWAVYTGVANGIDAEHFAPTASCTRAQIVTFLYRIAERPLDVEPEAWDDVRTDYSSLEELNAAFGCGLASPAGADVTNEVFYSRDALFTVEAVYGFTLGDVSYEYTFSVIPEGYDPRLTDVYGVYENVEINCYDGFYSAAWYTDEGAYFFAAVSEPDENGEMAAVTDEETFVAMAEELSGREAAVFVTDELFDSVSQRATASVNYIRGRKDVILAVIEWPESAFCEHMWIFIASAKEGDPNKLFYDDCDYYVTTYDEEGNVLTDDNVYYDGEGYIELDGDRILWTGASDEFCRGCVFEAAE